MSPIGRALDAPRQSPRPPARSRAVVVAVTVAVSVGLVAGGCVGKRGRNDDVVAPGSDGRARIERPHPLGPDPAARR